MVRGPINGRVQKTLDRSAKKVYQYSKRATVAQLAEHLTRNEDVDGSNPPGGSRIKACDQTRLPRSACR